MSLDVTDPRNPERIVGVPRPRLLKALTSVRFFAAVHVALYHMVRPFERWGAARQLMTSGYTAVSFFFALSGFILVYSHAAERDFGRAFRARFWFARFARLYPVYLLVMLVIGACSLADFHQHRRIVVYLAQILLVQSWVDKFTYLFNLPAWTLSCEAFFYLVFPFVVGRMIPKSRRAALVTAGLCYVAAMIVPAVLVAHFRDAAWYESSLPVLHGARRLPLLHLPVFLAGISVGWLYVKFRPRPRTALLLTYTGCAGLLLCLCFSDHLPFIALNNGLLLPFHAMLLVGLSEENWISRALSSAPLLLLGEASYSLYLIHVWLSTAVLTRLGMKSDIRGALLQVAVCTAIAIGLHLLVERPSRRTLLRWWKNRAQSHR